MICKIITLIFLLSWHTCLAAEIAFSPRQGATELVIETIESAKKTIEVAAYSFTSEPIAKALLKAQKRGVKVRIILDKSQRTTNYSSYNFFINHNIDARINNQYAIMHNKFMIIDGVKLQLGSFNYTKAAEEKNAENVLVISLPYIVENYSLQWNKLWKESN